MNKRIPREALLPKNIRLVIDKISNLEALEKEKLEEIEDVAKGNLMVLEELKKIQKLLNKAIAAKDELYFKKIWDEINDNYIKILEFISEDNKVEGDLNSITKKIQEILYLLTDSSYYNR